MGSWCSRQREQLIEGASERQGRAGRFSYREHGADGEKHLGDGQRRTPLLTQNVEADAAIAVDVGMVDFCAEGYL